MDNMKVCIDCGVNKPLVEYHLCASGKDGHYNYCGKCRSKRVYRQRGGKKTNPYLVQ